MRQWKSSLLLILLAAVCLPQTSSEIMTPAVRRVADKLACKCGCNNSVGTCTMLQCHYAEPARQKVAALQAEGKSDDDVLKVFVQESGLSALAVPPTEGFSLLAWIMPFIVLGLGLGAVTLYVKRYHPKRAAAAAAALPEVDPEVLARYRDRIDKEVSRLE